MADQHVNSQIAEGLFEVAQERDNAAVYREDLKFLKFSIYKLQRQMQSIR